MPYKNLTISGLPGCGSTTLLKMVRAELEPQGWQGFSGGEFMRKYALEKGSFSQGENNLHHDATVYGEDFDREVDFGMRAKLEHQEKWILESWLSGFLAQSVPGVLKVLLICSDNAVRVDRIVNRDNVSVQEALEHIRLRKEKNEQKWRTMYAQQWKEWVVAPGTLPEHAQIDFWNPALYDVVIDTYSSSREQTLEKVLDALRS